MQAKINLTTIGKLLRRHWFNILLMTLILFVFLKKDLSFSINMVSPDKVEQTVPKKKEHRKAPDKREFLTDKGLSQKEQKSKLNILGLNFGDGDGAKVNRKELLDKIDREDVIAFINRFSHVAENEQKKYGIPASIIIANALYLSSAGKHELSRRLNNHFGIPCTAAWPGQTENVNGTCYRKYESAWAGFRDHSVVISTGVFADLLKLGSKDYTNWARGLDRLNFMEDDSYADHLITIIQQYSLHQFDD